MGTGATAAYVYDAEDRRVQKTTAGGTVDYVYDIAGRQVAEVNSSGALNRGEVYAGGRRTSVTDQNGKTTAYAYDDADRLISVTDTGNKPGGTEPEATTFGVEPTDSEDYQHLMCITHGTPPR